jgi:hypothetical protein
MSKPTLHLSGQRFGRLVVIERGQPGKHWKSRWWCRCDCGSPAKLIYATSLLSGQAKSCGCLKRDKAESKESIKRRFLSQVNFNGKGGCWLWTSHKNKGYGRFWHSGHRTGAHRAAYQLFRGPVPPGQCVCHTCDVRACVNPKHLWLGPNSKNIEDRQNKENQAKGERHPRAKLTEADVIEIRSSKESYYRFALRKGLSKSCVRHAAVGRSWRYLNALFPPRHLLPGHTVPAWVDP